MPPHAERRISVRYDCTGHIRFTQFNREKSDRARVIDFSEEGLRFQANFEIKPGSSLLIQVESIDIEQPEIVRNIVMRSFGIAEVKWCRVLEDQPTTLYTAGVKFFLSE